MALIKCSECGKKISDKATTCIHCGCPISKNKSNIKNDEKNLNKTSLIIVGINILITLISMIFVLIKVGSNFYKAVFPVYFGILFINVIILSLIIKKKMRQKDIKLVSIGLLIISIPCVLFYSIFMINKYSDYEENRDEKIGDMLNQYRCETIYNGYWSNYSGTCYYDGGSTRVP